MKEIDLEKLAEDYTSIITHSSDLGLKLCQAFIAGYKAKESEIQQQPEPIEDIELAQQALEILKWIPATHSEHPDFDEPVYEKSEVLKAIKAALQQKGNNELNHSKKQQAEWQDYLTVAADEGKELFEWVKASWLKEINWPTCIRYDGGGAPYYETVCSLEELHKLVSDINPLSEIHFAKPFKLINQQPEHKIAEQITAYVHEIDSLRETNRKLGEKIKQQGNGWISVEDKPLIHQNNLGWEVNEGVPDEFWAALQVHNKMDGKTYWWIRHCVIEDGIGLCVVGDDENEPCGWQITDIQFWQPLAEPPKL